MKRIGVILFLSAIIMNGCVITSFNPFYLKSDLVTDDQILGQWIEKKALLTFHKLDESNYLLNYKDCEDPYNAPDDFSTCTMAEFTVHLMKLGDNFFMDIYPRTFLNTDNLFSNLHIRATHSIARVEIGEEQLSVSLMDYNWMELYLEKNKSKLDHIITDDFVTLSATTMELQSFILEHQSETGFYSKPMLLKKR